LSIAWLSAEVFLTQTKSGHLHKEHAESLAILWRDNKVVPDATLCVWTTLNFSGDLEHSFTRLGCGCLRVDYFKFVIAIWQWFEVVRRIASFFD